MTLVRMKTRSGFGAARAWLLWGAMGPLFGLMACGDGGPATPVEPEPLVIEPPTGLAISEPAAGSSPSGLAAPGDVYISASPGSFPDGVSATVTNLATAAAVNTDVTDGGFDPVVLPGLTDQQLEIVVRNRDGSTVLARTSVPRSRRPTIVRTRPADGDTDIILNSSMIVVFSEPLDRATVTVQTFRLLQGGATVGGTIAVRTDGLLAQFTPAQFLAPNTRYTLVMTPGVIDLSGDALEEEVTASFITETLPAVQLAFTVEPTVTHGNQRITPAIKVAIVDAFGNTVTGTTGIVTIALGADPGGGTLAGTTTVSAVGGVATFDDFRIDRPGSGYTLVASAEGLTSATSAAFDIFLSFVSVSASSINTCGVTTPGDAYCWGFGGFGNLGDGTGSSNLTPVLVSGGLSFTSLDGTCGVTSAGDAYCWGENRWGQLGDGTTTDRHTPVLVAGGLSYASLSAAGSHTCGVVRTGEAYCWGLGGTLGDGTTIDRLTPVRMSGGLSFTSLSNRCGVASGGDAYCWGGNRWGQLGDGTTTERLMPVRVTGGLNFISVSTNFSRTCAVITTEEAYCWGLNRGGQLGDGTKINRLTPVLVSGGLSFASVSARGVSPCGVTSVGEAHCWGPNDSGQLGDGTTIDKIVPVRVSGGLSFMSLSAGSSYVCGVTTTGEAYCWGNNSDGQLGDGTTTTRLTPVRVVQ